MDRKGFRNLKMQSKPGNILLNQLLVRNKTANFLLRVINSLFLVKNETGDFRSNNFNRILISNNAHLGDVILSTAILNTLKSSFPGSEIGILCGSWSNDFVSNHPLINYVHFYDHWKLNRANKPFISKLFQHFKSAKRSFNEIKKVKYDIAIDLYFFYPNSIFFLWIAGIPHRIGYLSGGYGNLLTRSVEWHYEKKSVVFYHLDLLRQITSISDSDNLKPSLPSFSARVTEKINNILKNFPNYIVIHVGTGLQNKEWPNDYWKKLVENLSGQFDIVFTGYGKREEAIISELYNNPVKQLNLCGKLSLKETSFVISKAQALICVDSVAGHIGSAFDIPTVLIGNGINDELMWRPFSSKLVYLVNKVSCMPCYTGCKGMECVRGVQVHSVMTALKKLRTKI